MNLLIRNVHAITLDAAGTVLRQTNIGVEGQAIAFVGAVPIGWQADETIDGYNHVAVPGFFNAHCHAAMTLTRGYAEDLPLDRWFNERIWKIESALTPDDVYWGTALAACEMLRAGCVGFNDHYFFMERAAEVVEQSGMKATLAWCQFGIGADKELSPTDALAFTGRWHNQAAGRLRTVLGPHSPYVCPPGFLREISALAHAHQLPLHIHLSEAPEQMANSLATHGKTPTAYLAECGVFEVPCVAAHALYLTDEDVQILAEKRVSVAHCPTTYMKMGMAQGVDNLERLTAAGVNVALGTDGAGSNNDMDMKAVVRQAALLQKYHTRNAEVLAGDVPLRMATANSARAMGFENSGELAPGRAADITLFDFDQPHLYPQHNLVANLIHSARGSDVTHVIVDGRVLYRNGELLTLDEEKIKAEAQRHAHRRAAQATGQMLKYKG